MFIRTNEGFIICVSVTTMSAWPGTTGIRRFASLCRNVIILERDPRPARVIAASFTRF